MLALKFPPHFEQDRILPDLYQGCADIKIIISNTHDPLKYLPEKELTSVCRPVLTPDLIRNIYYLQYLFRLEKQTAKK